MNEILTLTVSKLFVRPSEKSSSAMKDATIAEKANATSGSEMIAEMKSKFTQENVDKKIEDDYKPGCMDLERWISIEGPKRLESSLKKLRLNMIGVKRKDFKTYTEDEIHQEKRNVKNELKYYDSAFIKIFARPPAREDKEPMRPLYMYYQNLRKAIQKKAYAKGSSDNGKKSRPSSVDSSGGFSVGSVTSNISGSSIGDAIPESKVGVSTSKFPFTEEEAKKGPPLELMARMGMDNERDLKKQIHDFMKERKHLRKVLDMFQKDFLKTYNRKLRFTKDISPVASEFKRYKELKKEIAKLENILTNLKKKSVK
ncbi:unnamed protein product [Moneuplotes crassus]|uniref:FAM13A-like domain-containing protein n=1 Tax=Euplotes crassus TaxID=5936 RepID=A0AAD1XM57_EUPCR|nr:unnamed protein product [Moneuplotes crassus]